MSRTPASLKWIAAVGIVVTLVNVLVWAQSMASFQRVGWTRLAPGIEWIIALAVSVSQIVFMILSVYWRKTKTAYPYAPKYSYAGFYFFVTSLSWLAITFWGVMTFVSFDDSFTFREESDLPTNATAAAVAVNLIERSQFDFYYVVKFFSTTLSVLAFGWYLAMCSAMKSSTGSSMSSRGK